MTQNYNRPPPALNSPSAIPLKPARLPACGIYYSLTIDDYRVFDRFSTDYFSDHHFRSGIQGSNALAGIQSTLCLLQLHLQHRQQPHAPAHCKENTAVLQTSGIWGNVRYIPPMMAYKQSGHALPDALRPLAFNVLGLRAPVEAMLQGYAAPWLRPTTLLTPVARATCRV